ncbi:flippase [Patescibacteria group bacterium]|nr:MAG: flippase [Patescibacteria group bacterium]
MSTAQRVFHHTAIQVAARGAGTLLGLVAIGIMTRSLGREGFGEYAAVTAYLGVFAVLIDFGISTTLVAMLSEVGAEEKKLASGAFGLRLASTAALLAVAALGAYLTPYSPAIKNGIALLAVSYLLVAAQQIQLAVYQRHLRMDKPALAEVIGRIILVAGVALAAQSGSGLNGFLVAVIAANALQALIGNYLLKNIAPLAPAFDWQVWKKIIHRAWPIGAAIVFNLIYLRADIVILSLTRPLSEVGLYGAAYRVVDVLTIFPMLFMGIILPFLSRAWSLGEKEKFCRVLQRALDALALLAAPLVVVTWLIGPELLALIAGANFRPSGEMLKTLIFGVAAIFIAAAFTHAVVAVNAQRRMLKWLAADAAVSFFLYWLLIPPLGVPAAAAITVLSEALAMLAAIAVAISASGARLSLSVSFRAVLSALGMFAMMLPFAQMPVVIQLFAALIAYLALAVLLKAITPRNIRELLALRSSPIGDVD